MKKAFSLIEVIIVITILAFVGSLFSASFYKNDLENAINRITIYLKQTRYQALIDNKENLNDNLWHKKRWTLKFFRCDKNVGGLYYSIYSDINKTGHPGLEESLNDPLSNKKVFSTNKCEYRNNTSKYVLLTKEFGIKEVDVSCNTTSSLGQISFDNDGKVYSKLSSYDNEHFEYELDSRCKITLKDYKNDSLELFIEPKTGFVHRNN